MVPPPPLPTESHVTNMLPLKCIFGQWYCYVHYVFRGTTPLTPPPRHGTAQHRLFTPPPPRRTPWTLPKNVSLNAHLWNQLTLMSRGTVPPRLVIQIGCSIRHGQ